MGFSIEQLIALRPFAYHTSGRENFESILERSSLRSTRAILEGTEHESLVRSFRKESFTLHIDGRRVVIRDNKPLRPGSLDLRGGWAFEDLLENLNSRVFLWPGTECGPIKRGVHHFERYASEGEVFVLRIPLHDLVSHNSRRRLYVTGCNSGSARHQQGKPVARGPETFQTPETADFRPSQVIELSYVDVADLPPSSEWSISLDGPWSSLPGAPHG